MDCPSCDQLSPAGALACAACGESFLRRYAAAPLATALARTPSRPLLLPAVATDSTIAKARSFLISALILHAVFALWLFYFGPLVAVIQSAVGARIPVALPLAVLLLVYGILLVAYLIGSTAEAGGGPFRSNSCMALFPPLLPAVWARLGRRSMLLPYGYLLLDLGVVAVMLYGMRWWPWLYFVLMLVSGPLIIYHFFGCALERLGARLGLNPVLTVCWFGFLPYAMCAVLVGEIGLPSLNALFMDYAHAPWARRSDLSEALLTLAVYDVYFASYLLITWVIWIKPLYDKLNYSQR